MEDVMNIGPSPSRWMLVLGEIEGGGKEIGQELRMRGLM